MYHKSESHDVWFLNMKCNRQIFFVLLGHFLPFYPPNSSNNENIKNEKKPGDIIILYKCTKNHAHRLYFSWDMARDGCNCYFQYFSILLPNNSPTNENKSWRYRHFIQVYQKSWSYAILFLRYGSEGCNYFSLSAFFFALLPPWKPKKSKFQKHNVTFENF